MYGKKTARSNEKGFASLVIAIILVVILGLITVGFAQLMRHEQQASLDKQLSNQAYYAAESGINDAIAAINAGYNGTKSSCQGGVDTALPGNQYINDTTVGGSSSPTSASFTCLLIDPNPRYLLYDDVTSSVTKVAEFEGLDPTSKTVTPISTLEVSWHAHDNPGIQTHFYGGNCATTLPDDGSWQTVWGTSTGLLRFGITPISSGAISRNSLIANTYTGYFCPNATGSASAPGVSSYAAAHSLNTSGGVTNGNCNAANVQDSNRAAINTQDYCNVYVTNLDASGSNTFFFNMRSIYAPSTVTITAYRSGVPSHGTQLLLTGAEVLVDATGKAQNVLRRIQAHVPVHNEYNFPTEIGGEICKQLQIQPSSIVNPCE